MGPFDLMHRAIDVAADMPGLRAMRRVAYDRRFAQREHVNYYRGVYDSFEAAAESAPPTKATGYDNEAAAAMYDDGWQQPLLQDYPALFWLRHGLDNGLRSVFDLGGHVGIKYYAFRDWLQYPADTRWTVCDVPAVVQRGRALAATRDSAGLLHFTERAGDADGHDMLFASGSLQYLPWTLDQALKGMRCLPRRLVINTTAIHPRRSFFTLNSIGAAFCPYRVQAEAPFVSALESLGYQRRDRWETPKEFTIPFHQGYDLDHFMGYCFDLRSDTTAP